ncbi:hypothetical protein P9125_08055 [Bacillus mojavensis]|uniref:hypothetical protein n=1 Tax=Bacillus mojavensis TaxID=72360 RepID=UPI001EEE3F4B|nr:hypothetical protein [Bacillus mojavensis]MEC3587887.1 hypothetical protein [Bacillus mojavensis]MEC5244144.1 hypothetical protein [Bacillus mojavensis]MED0750402.1 hypothetical protein [Bacillus mojavensis]
MVALLREAGESLSAIQRRAGHASTRTTSDIYGHVTEKLENSTVKHFNQFDPRNLAQNQLKKIISSPIRPQVDE